MQSCSMSSLGRWSMEVLTGKKERGFFFFSKSGAEHGHADGKTSDHNKSQVDCRGNVGAVPCLSLLFATAGTFVCDSTGTGIKIHQ